MENSDLIAFVAKKVKSCGKMYIRTRKNLDGCSEEEKAAWMDKWKTSAVFWLKSYISCRKIDCIGGEWNFAGQSFTWRIYAENGDLFFSVNGKRLPMKKIPAGYVYQLRKRSVNYSDLESIITHFLETTMDEKSAFKCATAHVFEWIEKYGK